jgi:hypothetical protein
MQIPLSYDHDDPLCGYVMYCYVIDYTQ